MAQRSDEHGGLASSRWDIRHRLRSFVLQKLYVPLVYKSEVVLELETELSSFLYGVGRAVSFETSPIFVAIESVLRYHAQIICVLTNDNMFQGHKLSVLVNDCSVAGSANSCLASHWAQALFLRLSVSPLPCCLRGSLPASGVTQSSTILSCWSHRDKLSPLHLA